MSWERYYVGASEKVGERGRRVEGGGSIGRREGRVKNILVEEGEGSWGMIRRRGLADF